MLPLNQTLARAYDAVTKPATYVLGAGGRNPSAPTPFTTRDGKTGSDCVGWVCWALGIDRYQPKTFNYYGGWMNTDSIIYAAKHEGVGGPPGLRWRQLESPEPGAIVIFPSLYANGKMARMGHTGLIVSTPTPWCIKQRDWNSWSPAARQNLLQLITVIDCNASLVRRIKGKAIAQTTMAALWDKPDTVIAKLETI